MTLNVQPIRLLPYKLLMFTIFLLFVSTQLVSLGIVVFSALMGASLGEVAAMLVMTSIAGLLAASFLLVPSYVSVSLIWIVRTRLVSKSTEVDRSDGTKLFAIVSAMICTVMASLLTAILIEQDLRFTFSLILVLAGGFIAVLIAPWISQWTLTNE